MERDTFFLPENFRRLVSQKVANRETGASTAKLDANDAHYLGAPQFYELGLNERIWNDGGPGVCFSMTAILRMATLLFQQKRDLPVGQWDRSQAPSSSCQLYFRGHREDMMLAVWCCMK